MAHILMIDDSDTDRSLYREWLENEGHTVNETEDSASGMDAMAQSMPDVILLDFLMLGSDGFQTINDMKDRFRDLPPIIFLTGHHNDMIEEDAKALGVACYINKNDASAEQLAAAVRDTLERP